MVVMTDLADLVKQTRASLVQRFKQMGLTAGVRRWASGKRC